MKKVTKIFSVLLAMLMVLSIVPLTVFAEEAELKGKCGDNLEWKIVSDTDLDGAYDILVIEGSGNMYDFTAATQPWAAKAKDIYAIVAYEGLTSIGAYAFANFEALESVEFGVKKQPGEAVKNNIAVGECAFANCKSLDKIVFPNGDISLADNAFTGCIALTDFCHGDGNRTIASKAFDKCGSLMYVNLGKGDTTIGDSAFVGTGLVEITADAGVVTIGNDAFMKCSHLKTVKFAGQTKSIGEAAFADCTSLETADIPKGMTEIARGTFSNCTSLKSFYIHKDVKTVAESAFWGCTSLENIYIAGTVTKIEDNAFNRCDNIAKVRFGGARADWDKLEFGKNNDAVAKSENVVFNDCDHKYTEKRDKVEPTCTTGGYTEGVICLDCEAYVEGHEPISKQKDNYHDWEVKTVIKASTCVTEGKAIYVCKHNSCHIMYDVLAVDKDAHKNVKKIDAVAPTGDKEGHEAGERCEDCGEIINGLKEIAKREINFVDCEYAVLRGKRIFTYVGVSADKLLAQGDKNTYIVASKDNSVPVVKEVYNGYIFVAPVRPEVEGSVEKKLEIVVMGDTNSDGKISAEDARYILRTSVELEKVDADTLMFDTCDINKDGKISAADARSALRASVELEKPADWIK